MRSRTLQVVIEEATFSNGKKGYRASSPSLDGWHSWGRSIGEALASLREAIEVLVEDRGECGVSVPSARAGSAMGPGEASVVVDVRRA